MSSKPAPDIMADEALIERYNNGDAAAFDILYERHRKQFYNFLVKTTRDTSLAEDIYQTCWEKIIEKRDEFVLRIHAGDPPFKFINYLYTMGRNAWLDHTRSSAYKTQISMTSEDDDEPSPFDGISDDDSSNPDERYRHQQLLNKINDAISLLAPEQREAFLLTRDNRLTLEQVAEIQGVGRETVKSRNKYALQKLKHLLQEWLP
ncbi:sigma-70 family RNA polymerase sigma factor [Endozoicomonas ascidiicola]|uniref:sigma-70 family RNA polymerase sigma factor n=1 Tax=Endozoicomonas ascidiicola TaxID=1698521 RepID=UPI00082DC77C|nr:sigma-70 family RNA polymerase sigma factor [Endozoicomonas ascidiicola]